MTHEFRLAIGLVAAGWLIAGCGDGDAHSHSGPDVAAGVAHEPGDGHGLGSGGSSQTAASGAGFTAGDGPAVDMSKGWCAGHGVPESVCTRCSPSLIDQFKAAGDWCAGHGLPESQCLQCNPEVAERWAALNPERSPAPPLEAPDDGIRLERRPLTGGSDPLCQVDALQVRFVDDSILDKAGIRVEPARRRRIASTLDAPAEVQFDETRVTRVMPRVAGIALEVPAHMGDGVEPGDLLAVIDSPGLGEAKSLFIERRQNLKLAQSDLERIRAIADGATRMLEVCTAEAEPATVRAALKDAPVGDAKAKLLRAHAALQLARIVEARERGFLTNNMSSQQGYDEAAAALAVAEAEFVAQREEIAFDADRDLLAAERAVEVAQAAVDAAGRSLQILGLSQSQIDSLGDQIGAGLSRYELRSPVVGRVVERSVASGESVTESDALFTLADTSTMWLLADVHESELPMLREGTPLLFTVDGMPGVSFEGRLSWISSRVNDRTRTVQVRADLPNPDGLLRARMFGRARLVVGQPDEVVSVPTDAVQTDGCCQLVFVQAGQALFAPRKVALGASSNGFVEILRGLEDGERIAHTGSFLLKTEILKGNIGAGCCEVDPGR